MAAHEITWNVRESYTFAGNSESLLKSRGKIARRFEI